MPDCTIRPLASDEEAQQCAALMAVSDPWQTLGMDHAALLRMVRRPEREFYVAAVEAGLAGCIILNLNGPLVGYIQTVCVASALRGQGYGSQLLAFAEERIFRDHANVFLCVSAFNGAARALYERLGYAQVGQLADFLVAGHAEILMRKTRGPISTYLPAAKACG